jgi:hypothetical protein
MKNLVIIALVLVSVAAQAKGKKMTAEYKAAKAACLSENKDLKGKALKECITSKETAAPAAAATAPAAAAPAAAPAPAEHAKK